MKRNYSILSSLFFLLSALQFFLISLQSIVSAQQAPPPEKNGRHITAYGKLNALFLFVQFDDDSVKQSDEWPYDTLNLPSWANTFINGESSNNFPVKNLSHYFHEMSLGKFQLRGYVYPKLIRPKHEQSYYKNIGEVNSEILIDLDNEIDFSKFDNWEIGNDGNYINNPDGTVDMIFMIYRHFDNRLFFNNGWTGSAELYLEKDIKTNDGVIIKKGAMKSGLQMRGGINGFEYTKYVAAHEFGHFLFGGIHFEGLSNLCLMAGGPVWNACRGMMAVEREMLGWINYKDINTSKDSLYTVFDYMTRGEAFRINLKNGEYFVIENRQKKSVNDWAADKGLYIYHVQNGNSFSPKVDVLCADGNWKFEINKTDSTITKSVPDRNGKNEMNFVGYAGEMKMACYKPVYKNDAAWGDEYDAFDDLYNNVFSPVSNPPSVNKSNFPFTIEIVENKKGIIKFRTFFQDPYAGKPSRPQGVKIKIGEDSIPLLEWMQNTEPDLIGYKVYRFAGTFDEENKTVVGYIQKMLNDDSDTVVWRDKDFGKNREKNVFYYAVTSLDYVGRESLFSDPVLLE